MTSISEHLEYLNESKSLLKTAIVNKGVAVADETAFKQYAKKIKDIKVDAITVDRGTVPDLTGEIDMAELLKYLEYKQTPNVDAGFNVASYAHGVATVSQAYSGGVYSPTQNRIYLVPAMQATETIWHYIDCNTGEVVGYTHGITTCETNGAYMDGVYSPTQDRIYFIPMLQSTAPVWHYIDCRTGNVVEYAHGLTDLFEGGPAYVNGSYSPTQNRIYLSPFCQCIMPNWHYIDCNTGNVVSYAHGATAEMTGYGGSTYSPTQNRIYLTPFVQATTFENWHYIDCDTGLVVEYAHGLTPIQVTPAEGENPGTILYNEVFQSSVYSPTQNRIYLIPQALGEINTFCYIDCNDGTINRYTAADSFVADFYMGAVYSPTSDRIYFVNGMSAGSPGETQSMYVECATDTVVTYTHGVAAVSEAYVGGVYSPTQNRIYLTPLIQATEPVWHYIQEYSSANISPRISANSSLSKAL